LFRTYSDSIRYRFNTRAHYLFCLLLQLNQYPHLFLHPFILSSSTANATAFILIQILIPVSFSTRCVTKESKYWARSEWIPVQYPKYITGTDRHTVRAQTVLSLTQPYNTRYEVKYPFFAQFLTPIGAQNPLIYLYTGLPYILLQMYVVYCKLIYELFLRYEFSKITHCIE
jgi:hypothetical protein